MKASVADRILALLGTVPEGISAPELRRRLKLKVSQPTLWRHLDALRSRGLLWVEGQARATRYRATAGPAVLRHLESAYKLPRYQEKPLRGVREDAAHPVQVASFRRMAPAEKLQMVADLYRAGIQLKVAGLRAAHPDWTEARLLHEARLSLLYAGT